MSKVKLTKKRKRQLLAMFAITGMMTNTVTNVIVVNADEVPSATTVAPATTESKAAAETEAPLEISHIKSGNLEAEVAEQLGGLTLNEASQVKSVSVNARAPMNTADYSYLNQINQDLKNVQGIKLAVDQIPADAFANNNWLKVLDTTATTIADTAFSTATALTEITANLTDVSELPTQFEGSMNTITSLTLPNVENTPDGSFFELGIFNPFTKLSKVSMAKSW